MTLTSRAPPSRPLTNLVIRVPIGRGATSVTASVNGGAQLEGGKSGGAGRWDVETEVGEVVWRVDSLVSVDRPAVLTGQFLLYVTAPSFTSCGEICRIATDLRPQFSHLSTLASSIALLRVSVVRILRIEDRKSQNDGRTIQHLQRSSAQRRSTSRDAFWLIVVMLHCIPVLARRERPKLRLGPKQSGIAKLQFRFVSLPLRPRSPFFLPRLD